MCYNKYNVNSVSVPRPVPGSPIARASSNHGKIKEYGPQLALDKKISKSSKYFFHSRGELLPWLEIAFSKGQKIGSVKIFNR